MHIMTTTEFTPWMPVRGAGKQLHSWIRIAAWGHAVEGACMQDIDDILRNRTEKRQLGNSKGNTFSTATFTIEEEPQVIDYSQIVVSAKLQSL